MKIKFILLLLLSFLIILGGCNTSEKENFVIWLEGSTSSQATVESAMERLKNANIEYKIDEEGNVLIKKKDMEKATVCCS